MQDADQMSRREPTPTELRRVAQALLPPGWTWEERPAPNGVIAGRVGGYEGWCDFATQTIVTLPLVDRYSFYVFLHELGHVACGHGDEDERGALQEWEAERYAQETMRGMGFACPREALEGGKDYVRETADAEEEHDYPPEMIRYLAR